MTRSTVSLAAGVVVFVVTIAAVVILKVEGVGTDEVVTLASGPIAALLVAGYVGHVTGQQNAKLDRIDENTNGKLRQIIRDEIRAARSPDQP